MKFFAKNSERLKTTLIIFAKSSILDVWQGSEYAIGTLLKQETSAMIKMKEIQIISKRSEQIFNPIVLPGFGVHSGCFGLSNPWTEDVNWAYIRRSEDVLEIFKRLMFVLLGSFSKMLWSIIFVIIFWGFNTAQKSRFPLRISLIINVNKFSVFSKFIRVY